MHEIAKLILEHAETLCEREDAVRHALFLGMPLNEIEVYLDWLEIMRKETPRPPPSKDPEGEELAE